MAASTTGSIAALFSTESKAAAAIEALQASGFQAHQLGAARSAEHTSTATETGVSNETTATGTTGMGTGAEGILDTVKNFFKGTDEPQGTVGSVAEYANESGLPNAAGFDAHTVTGGDYPFRKDDVSALLGSLNVSNERAQYFERSLRAQPGSVLVTLSAAERQGEAERILNEHGGDLGGASS